MKERHVILILGMGRSGTSAVTRMLSLCGAALPEPLLGPNDSNPAGHWEPLDALKLNSSFLLRHGSNWYDPTLRLQDENALEDRECKSYLDQITAFLASCPPVPLLAIKDPRISALPAFWIEAARRAEYGITVVIPVRHPGEVAASLARRDRASFELSCVLWLKYNLLAEQHSRALPRVFVDFSTLLHDWRWQVARIQEVLTVRLDAIDSVAIDAFLRDDLSRQRLPGALDDQLYSPLVRRMYAHLSSATRDEALDLAAIDAIFAEYCMHERTFRIANDDFRARFHPFAQDGFPKADPISAPVEQFVVDSPAQPANGHLFIDDVTIDGKCATGSIVMEPANVLSVRGWGVDRLAGDVGRAVFAIANNVLIRGDYGFARSDVAETLRNSRYFQSGFRIDIGSGCLPPGDHAIDIRLLAADQKSVYSVASPLLVSVRRMS